MLPDDEQHAEKDGCPLTHREADLVTAGGISCPVTLADGQVRVHLPFSVDPRRLSAQLLREGYALAHEANTPDTQGWGPDFSPNGYYPYYVFPDPDAPGRSVFAFYPNPEDAVSRGAGEPVRPSLGDRSRETMERWVPVLARLSKMAGGDVH